MSLAGYILLVIAAAAGAMVVWSYLSEASARRHPANPRYCHEPRCLRLAGHIGAHIDDAGRSWN